ncbi:hypothetical protein [Methylomagnum sp.]
MNFNIGEIHPNSPHLFADLAELLLLIGYGGRNWIHKNDLLALRTSASTSLEEIDQETAIMEGLESNARRHDRLETQLEDVWTQLEYRSGAMKHFYPFVVRGDKLLLLDQLNIKHRSYRLLVACSRLRSFAKKGIPQRWAKSFTLISRLALHGLMPPHASIRIFDANSEDRREYYSTDLRDALVKLGIDLCAFKIDKEECRKVPAQGDGGIDLVATIDFSDGAAGTFAIIGQCGAQETGWPSKTLEATPVRFRNFFSIPFDWPSIMFTPVCYRNSNGEWVDNQSTNGILLADRLRILSLLEKMDVWSLLADAEWFSCFEKEFKEVQYSS